MKFKVDDRLKVKVDLPQGALVYKGEIVQVISVDRIGNVVFNRPRAQDDQLLNRTWWASVDHLHANFELTEEPVETPAEEPQPKTAPNVKGTNPKDLVGVKKVNLHLVPPASRVYQAMAMADGAKKYDPYNWRDNKVVFSVYYDALNRHMDAYLDGEDNAQDSGLPHLAHAIANLGIIIDALESGNIIDDRPTKGPTPALLERFKKS